MDPFGVPEAGLNVETLNLGLSGSINYAHVPEEDGPQPLDIFHPASNYLTFSISQN